MIHHPSSHRQRRRGVFHYIGVAPELAKTGSDHGQSRFGTVGAICCLEIDRFRRCLEICVSVSFILGDEVIGGASIA